MSLHLIKKFEVKFERISLPDRGIEPATYWSKVWCSTNRAIEALVMELWNLEVYTLQFCFLQYMHFFAMAGIQSVWFYKKLCYKTLLLFYIDIFQFSFKHWYIFHFAFCSTNAVFSLWLIFTQYGFIRNCGIFSFLMHY